MADLYCYMDDCDITHWILMDTDAGNDDTQNLLKDAEHAGLPVRAFIKGADNNTLEDLGNFLFCTYHNEDDDYSKFLLRRFEGDPDAFATFLVNNLTREEAAGLTDRLAKKLKIHRPKKTIKRRIDPARK